MSHLKNLIHDLDQLKLDCEYWDVRIEDSFETAIDMVDGCATLKPVDSLWNGS